jgi:hypothetical protein
MCPSLSWPKTPHRYDTCGVCGRFYANLCAIPGRGVGIAPEPRAPDVFLCADGRRGQWGPARAAHRGRPALSQTLRGASSRRVPPTPSRCQRATSSRRPSAGSLLSGRRWTAPCGRAWHSRILTVDRTRRWHTHAPWPWWRCARRCSLAARAGRRQARRPSPAAGGLLDTRPRHAVGLGPRACSVG